MKLQKEHRKYKLKFILRYLDYKSLIVKLFTTTNTHFAKDHYECLPQ